MPLDIDLSISEGSEEKDFTTWEEVFEYFSTEYVKYDKINPAILVKAEKLTDPSNMAVFEKSARSLELGSSRVYRDDQDVCSIQVRVYPPEQPIMSTQETMYDDKMYYIQLNWHNPHNSVSALKHLIVDVLKFDIERLKNECEN